MLEQIKNILVNNNINIPKVLLTNYKKLNITEKQLIILIYLINEDKIFNPKKISEDLSYDMYEVLELINTMLENDLLEVIKVKTNKVEEHINLDKLYTKLSLLYIEKKEEENTNIFETFEKEFGRTLSPTEYEIIKAWFESKYSEEIILLALKEAVYNGVNRLNYIDKILYEWDKKGIKTKEDVEKNNQNFKNKKEIKENVFEYDWLNEN